MSSLSMDHALWVEPVFAALSCGIAAVDAQGVVLRANPAFWRMAGREPNGKPADLAHSSEQSTNVWELKPAELPPGGEPVIRLLHKPDGTPATLSIRVIGGGEPSEGGESEPVWLLEAEDRTEEAALKTRLARAEDSCRMLADAERVAHLETWRWDVDRDKVTWVHLHQDGVKWEFERDGKPLAMDDLVPAEERDSFRILWQKAKTGQPLHFEYRTRGLDGSEAHWSIRGVPHIDRFGRTTALSGIIQDVTDIKQVLGKLEESVERYTSLKKYNHDAVISIDLQGNVINTNRVAETLTGYTAAEMRGTSFSRYCGKENIRELLYEQESEVRSGKLIERIYHRAAIRPRCWRRSRRSLSAAKASGAT